MYIPWAPIFALMGNEGNYEATTVILASGVIAAKPFPRRTDGI